MAMAMSGRALLPLLLRRAQRRAVAPSKCGCIAGWKTAVHSAGGREWWRCGGLQAVLPEERFSVIPIRSSTSKIDACTETQINRSTSKIDACTETHINRRVARISL